MIGLGLALATVRNGGAVSAQTLAIVAAMATPPSATRVLQIDALVAAGLRDGWWTKLGALWMLAAADVQAASINWANPSGVKILAVNSPVFTADRGYASDGATSYLNTQVAANALAPFAQDDAHVGAAMNVLSGATGHLIGVPSGTNNRISRNAANTISTGINAAAISTPGTTFPAARHVMGNRSGAAGYDQAVDGAFFATVVQASVALAATSIALLRVNSGNFAGVTTQVRCAHMGASLTAPQQASIVAAIGAYLDAIGATP